MLKEYSIAEFIFRGDAVFDDRDASDEETLEFVNNFDKFSFDGDIKSIVVRLGPLLANHTRYANVSLYEYPLTALTAFPRNDFPLSVGYIQLQLKHGVEPRIDVMR